MVKSVYGNQYRLCRGHWREPVPVGRYVVTSSSVWASPHRGLLLPPFPGFGIYLASQWLDLLSRFWTNGCYLKVVREQRPYPALVIDWKDMGTIRVEDIAALVETCRSKLRRGLVVDIGCSAGHGRTGTLLACVLGRIEHLDAEEAIAAVRRRYCHSAVENVSQEELVRRYLQRYGIRGR